jgi:putative redox protein
MKARIKWLENMTYVAEAGSGHAIVVDGPADLGGRNLGVRPMELILMGLGSCSAVDVVHILKKARQPVTDCEVEIDAERAEVAPKVFTRIHMHFVVSGSDLSEKQVRRAVDLSAEKYCSASVMLKSSVTISHSYEIRKPAEETTAKL